MSTDSMIRAELEQAKSAFDDGRVLEAEQHLTNAHALGATKRQTARVRREAGRSAKDRENRRTHAIRIGLAAALAAYLLLSLRQPPAWSRPVWLLLAFLAVPAAAGWLAGRGQDAHRTAGQRFRAGAKAGGWAMALYTALNLILVHRRIASSGDPFGVLEVGLFVTLVYAAAAAVVAGVASAGLTRIGGGKGEDEPAS